LFPCRAIGCGPPGARLDVAARVDGSGERQEPTPTHNGTGPASLGFSWGVELRCPR
jgi:hypothetical protein